jgi:hypothetical protein
METPQEKLAERMYELLPHKKELEFGCVFNFISNNNKLIFLNFNKNEEDFTDTVTVFFS